MCKLCGRRAPSVGIYEGPTPRSLGQGQCAEMGKEAQSTATAESSMPQELSARAFGVEAVG